jgi:hypothetical protein
MAGPLLQTGNIVSMRVWAEFGPQASVNTFHFLVGVITGSVPDLQAAATSFDAVIETPFKLILGVGATYRGVQAYVNQLPQPLPQPWTFNAGAGTATGAMMGGQLCGLTKWLTDFAGPAYRGRTFWPFPTAGEDDTTGVPIAGWVTNATALSNAIRNFSSITGGGGGAAACSLVLSHGPNKEGFTPVPTPITGFSVEDVWATQKRRGTLGRTNKSPI